MAEELTITGTATLSNADGIITAGPLTLKDATLTFTGNINEDVGDDAIRAGRSDEDITIQNSTVTIAGTNSEGNFFQFGIRCGKLTVANSTLDVKANSSAIVVADEMKVSGVNTIVMAETGASEEEDDYALKLDNENSLTMNDGLVLVEGEVNKSKKAKIARSEQAPRTIWPTGSSARGRSGAVDADPRCDHQQRLCGLVPRRRHPLGG